MALLKQGLQSLDILGHVDGGGGGHLLFAQQIVENPGVHVPVVGEVLISQPPDGEAEGKDLNAVLVDEVGAQVGGGVGEDDEIRHKIALL